MMLSTDHMIISADHVMLPTGAGRQVGLVQHFYLQEGGQEIRGVLGGTGACDGCL